MTLPANDAHDWLPAGWLKFDDWAVPNPRDEATCNAAWRARFEQDSVTEADLYRLAQVFDAYQHFTTHPAPTNEIVSQLRAVRRAVKKMTT